MALDLLPRRDVPVVVFGAADGEADEAVGALAGLGFTDVAPLAGGLAAWVAGGGELFTDVNAPSKAFGELVEALAATPSVAADELHGWLAAGADLALGRRPHVRGAPHDDRARARAARPAPSSWRGPASFAPDPATTIVVHCAGRTRSIIGAQSLVDAGVPNRVVALRDGTIGWMLAGLELTLGDTASVDLVTPPSAESRRRAADVAARAGVPTVDVAVVDALLDDRRRTVYRIDVRARDEHVTGHPAGFALGAGRPARAGDGRRGAGARCGGRAVRRPRRAGAHDRGVAGPDGLGRPRADGGAARPGPPPPGARRAARRGVGRRRRARRADAGTVVDVSLSTAYAAGHVPGAVWTTRRELVAFGDARRRRRRQRGRRGGGVRRRRGDGRSRRTAARASPAARRPGGPPADAWPTAGTDGRWSSTPDDVYVRPYVGTSVAPAVMQAYLDWEHGLVAQLGRDGTHRFWVLGAR